MDLISNNFLVAILRVSFNFTKKMQSTITHHQFGYALAQIGCQPIVWTDDDLV